MDEENDNIYSASALVTTTHRDWLRGVIDVEPQSGRERSLRSRLRSRLCQAILDFQYVFEGIREEDLEMVFERLSEDPRAQNALSGLIGFVFLGTTESHDDLSKHGFDFREILSDGITRAEMDRMSGGTPLLQTISVDFDVEKREAHNLDFERIFQKIQADDMGDLTSEEVYGFLQLYRLADDPTPEGMHRKLDELRESEELLYDDEFWERDRETVAPAEDEEDETADDAADDDE